MDPIPYLTKWGITQQQFAKDIVNCKMSSSSSDGEISEQDNYQLQEEEEMNKVIIRKDNKGSTAGYLYNGAFIVGGDTKKYNTIYQKLRKMETAGLIKLIKTEIYTAEYDALCEVYPSHRNNLVRSLD